MYLERHFIFFNESPEDLELLSNNNIKGKTP